MDMDRLNRRVDGCNQAKAIIDLVVLENPDAIDDREAGD